MTPEINPVRLCCGQRHSGPQCPDGRVMCCLCFDRVETSELNQLDDGTHTDVCKPCAAYEARALRERT